MGLCSYGDLPEIIYNDGFFLNPIHFLLHMSLKFLSNLNFM